MHLNFELRTPHRQLANRSHMWRQPHFYSRHFFTDVVNCLLAACCFCCRRRLGGMHPCWPTELSFRQTCECATACTISLETWPRHFRTRFVRRRRLAPAVRMVAFSTSRRFSGISRSFCILLVSCSSHIVHSFVCCCQSTVSQFH